MITKKRLNFSLKKAIFGWFFAIISLFSISAFTGVNSIPAYADEEDQTTVTVEETSSTDLNGGNSCQDSLGAIGWLVCPTTGKIAEAVDWLYEKIEDILVINPVEAKDGTPIYEVWKYLKGITNIAFIIFLLIVIYSQITGLGINNYGIKKVLPKIIVTAVLVNLSFIICQLAVDISNIVGNSLRGVFSSIGETAIVIPETTATDISYTNMFASIVGGGALAVGAGLIAFGSGTIWMLIPVVLGALVAVVSGLITIALRQAVVTLLIMISPLAMIAYMLPNTEKWFTKWKDLLFKMLIFYPMFSLLFGASQLAGFAIIASAKDGFGILLGTAVQIFPLFFSWSLMKMSGTFLGGINAKLNALAAGPLATNRAWAESKKAQTRANTMANGKTPYSHLMRYLDNRRTLREMDTENLQKIRKSEANIYAQRKISSGYDGTTMADGKKRSIKPNRYTRHAKDASNISLASETATLDTTHTINNYSDYYLDERTRKKITRAEKAKDQVTLNSIMRTNAEYRRSTIGATNFLELSRAQMTAENDSEADFNFMVGQFLAASTNRRPGVDGKIDEQAMAKYRHYIVSSAGGLGETGQTRVLGKIIAKAAAVESNQRRDIAIVAAKFPPDKRSFRNFLFNYYIDDDGYATDKDGNRIENMRDYLRVNDPGKLVMWDQFDENGPYFDWYDVNGEYVTRIYKKDKSAIKELMSNFDAPINDPINNMLAIHAGIKEQPDSEHEVLRHMGLDGFRTTVGRALLSAPFKEKNAAFSPMVAEMVKKGYIKNYAQEYLAYLDSFNKATKPGAFNTQDADAIKMFAMMMDPDKWDEIFPTELIRGYKNVNGEDIYGIRYDEDGNKIKVSANEATREELMERIKEKFIYPAASKITAMMSRQTQNTIDNQKPGTVPEWKALKEVFDKKWGDNKKVPINPYEQDGDMRAITRDIRESIKVRGEDDEADETNIKPSDYIGRRYNNHSAEVYNIYNSSLDADDFAINVSNYLRQFGETSWIADQVQDFIISAGYDVTIEQLYEEVESLLAYIDYD